MGVTEFRRAQRSVGQPDGSGVHEEAQQSARLLLDESHAGAVEVPQQALSEMLGVCRPSLNKVLKEFERRGLIRLRYGAVDILDRYGLAQRAD